MKNAFIWAFITQNLSQNFNRDNSKTPFNRCLLYVIRFTGLGLKANAETVFKT